VIGGASAFAALVFRPGVLIFDLELHPRNEMFIIVLILATSP
jgi:hypothetical protein